MKFSTSTAIVVNVLIAVIVLAVILDGPIRRSLVDDHSSKIPVSVLREQLESFPVWTYGVKRSGPILADRDVLTSASSRFHTDRTSREVIEYYSAFAVAQGWSPIESSLTQERRFCRDGVSFKVRADRLDRGVDYTIGLTWTGQVRGDSYCDQPQIRKKKAG